jgi:hypothetical protein
MKYVSNNDVWATMRRSRKKLINAPRLAQRLYSIGIAGLAGAVAAWLGVAAYRLIAPLVVRV